MKVYKTFWLRFEKKHNQVDAGGSLSNHVLQGREIGLVGQQPDLTGLSHDRRHDRDRAYGRFADRRRGPGQSQIRLDGLKGLVADRWDPT